MGTLLRQLSRVDAFAVALGGVIGVGVFRATGLALSGTSGFAGATWLWIGIGVVCLAGAIVFADLSARVPEAGGPYAYVRVAFGRPMGFVYGWLNAGISMPVRQASVMAVIGELLAAWLPGGERSWALGVLVLLVALNLLGVRAGALGQRLFTTGKLATIAFVLALAVSIDAPLVALESDARPSTSFAVAVGAVWYTFLGWQDVVLLAEELHEPRRTLAVVLVGTVAIVLVLYVGIHVAVYLGLGGDATAYGDLPALDLATRVLGDSGASIMGALMLSSMVGGAAEGMMVRPRLAMALGRDGMAPSLLAAVNRAGTPWGALLFHGGLVFALVATGSFAELLPLLVFAQGLLGVCETASYFAVRRKRPERSTSRFHPWAALLFLAASAALCVLAGFDDPVRAGLAILLLAMVAAAYGLLQWSRARRAP